jgi:ketol-acid reductoisomerase
MAIVHEDAADPTAIAGSRVAVVGYGNQGRSWALNLRDSACDVQVAVRRDETRQAAASDGFAPIDVEQASAADIICLLVPDDAIPLLPIEPGPESLVVVASGYSLAFQRIDPPGDVVMIAPRMLGSEVRECFVEGVGFITAIGVHRDVTGRASERMLAVAAAIGGLRRGGIEMTPMQEAVLDLAVEQVLSPALTHVNTAFVSTMLARGIPLEAVMCELFLSGEIERNYRMLREEGFVAQLDRHSPTSQYGQLSRRGRFDHLDVAATMAELVADIESGAFADEWDAEREAGHPTLAALRDQHASADLAAFERRLRESFDGA